MDLISCPKCQAVLLYNVKSLELVCKVCQHKFKVPRVKDFNDDIAAIEALLDLLRNRCDGSSEVSVCQNPNCQVHNAKFYTKAAADSPSFHSTRDISPFRAKLLGELFSHYAMDHVKRQATRLPPNKYPNCAQLATRSFSIDRADLGVPGYGRDGTGANHYLSSMLDTIQAMSASTDVPAAELVALHAEGDGYCLVHAVSRCLVGREFYWHTLCLALQSELRTNRDRYLAQLDGFYTADEWDKIVGEASPDYLTANADVPVGLMNVHAFGLANCLRRPIIIFDGDVTRVEVSGVFLPLLCEPSTCTAAPICIARSSRSGHHFVPLVPVRESPDDAMQLPRICREILPNVWGAAPEELDRYVKFEDGFCRVGGTKAFEPSFESSAYAIMSAQFLAEHGVSVDVVEQTVMDVLGNSVIATGTLIKEVVEFFRKGSLKRCVCCGRLQLVTKPFDEARLQPGGDMYLDGKKAIIAVIADCATCIPITFVDVPARVFIYNRNMDSIYLAPQSFFYSYLSIEDLREGGALYTTLAAGATLLPDKVYYAKKLGEYVLDVPFRFDPTARAFVPIMGDCKYCAGVLRQIHGTGEPMYKPGDRILGTDTFHWVHPDGTTTVVPTVPRIIQLKLAASVASIQVDWIDGVHDNIGPLAMLARRVVEVVMGDRAHEYGNPDTYIFAVSEFMRAAATKSYKGSLAAAIAAVNGNVAAPAATPARASASAPPPNGSPTHGQPSPPATSAAAAAAATASPFAPMAVTAASPASAPVTASPSPAAATATTATATAAAAATDSSPMATDSSHGPRGSASAASPSASSPPLDVRKRPLPSDTPQMSPSPVRLSSTSALATEASLSAAAAAAAAPTSSAVPAARESPSSGSGPALLTLRIQSKQQLFASSKITVPDPCTVAQLRQAIAKLLPDRLADFVIFRDAQCSEMLLEAAATANVSIHNRDSLWVSVYGDIFAPAPAAAAASASAAAASSTAGSLEELFPLFSSDPFESRSGGFADSSTATDVEVTRFALLQPAHLLPAAQRETYPALAKSVNDHLRVMTIMCASTGPTPLDGIFNSVFNMLLFLRRLDFPARIWLDEFPTLELRLNNRTTKDYTTLLRPVTAAASARPTASFSGAGHSLQ